MKKFFTITSVIGLFGVAAFLCFCVLILGVRESKSLSQSLLQKAESVSGKEKLIYLMQSDFLWPNDEKKFEIITSLEKNEDKKATEYYISKLRSREGLQKAASYFALKGDFWQAKIQANRTGEKSIQEEIIQFINLANGKGLNVNSPEEKPETEAWNLVNCVRTLDFSTLRGDIPQTRHILKIYNRDKESSEYNKLLEIADYLVDNQQHYLALNLLESITEKYGRTKPAYILEINTRVSLKDYKGALVITKEVLSNDPSDINLTTLAIDLADKAEDVTEKNFLEERLKYLKDLSKR